MKASKKIFGAVMALMVAIVLATGTTFAWFTTNRTPSLGGVDLNVGSGTDGLLVSLDGSKFSEKLTSEDLYKALNGNTTADKFEKVTMMPVTTKDGVAFTEKDGTTAVTYDGAQTDNKFLQLKLYFRSNKEYEVFLFNGKEDKDAAAEADKTASIVAKGNAPIYSTVKAWDDFIANKYTVEAISKGDTLAARAANAARVSFQLKGAADAKVWAPHEENAEDPAGFYLGNLANDYIDHMYGNTPATTVPTMSYTTTKSVAGDGYTANAGVFKLVDTTATDGFYTAEVTINIWLEGWDGDCFNAVMKDVFTVNLNFIGLTA